MSKPFDLREFGARAKALIRATKRERDRNPTTDLPGSKAIDAHLADLLKNASCTSQERKIEGAEGYTSQQDALNDLAVYRAKYNQRLDLLTETLVAIPGAPVSPQVALALGPDLSAWLLDPRGRTLLRYARDGRLAQTLPLPLATPTPVALALVDAGATALVADGASAQWLEQRGTVLNYASYIGHTPLRIYVMGADASSRTAGECSRAPVRMTYSLTEPARALG